MRRCAKCHTPIAACMGFVKAGDILDGTIPVRELCGRCVLVWQWTAEGELVPVSHKAVA